MTKHLEYQSDLLPREEPYGSGNAAIACRRMDASRLATRLSSRRETLSHRAFRPVRAAFTLIEVLIVVAILGILAGVALPQISPTTNEQLKSAGQILVAELDHARSLAVSYGTSYRVTLDADANQIVFEHSGSNSALDSLPASPFDATPADAKRRTTDLALLPGIGSSVHLHGATAANDTIVVDDLEFTAFGGTTRSSQTDLWLVAGSGRETRFMEISIQPVTGLVTLGQVRSTGPSATSP